MSLDQAPWIKQSLESKSFGVLFHITSIPGSAYSGDLGPCATTFLKWLAAAKASWWQVLPIHPCGDGFSPYSASSSFAGDPMLIDLGMLAKYDWVKPRELKVNATEHFGEGPTVTFEKSHSMRQKVLEIGFQRAKTTLEGLPAFQAFVTKEAYWLDDFCLFSALSKKLGNSQWNTWPKGLRDREPTEITAARATLKEDMLFAAFCQFLFQEQWDMLLTKAHELNIGLIGDLPIFISHKSADVWAHPEAFLLNEDKSPKVVAGCPPDSFNKDGQLWGNALYDWPQLKKNRYEWWINRFKRIYQLFDTVRLDHFIGFHRYWEVGAQEQTARNGVWRPGPGADLFFEVEKQLGKRVLIAEDLGSVVQEVRDLRDQFGFYGMKVFQFAFDGSQEAANHMPHRANPHAAIYTGTHDNNTLNGWLSDLKERGTKKMGARADKIELLNLTHYVAPLGRNLHETIIRQLMACPANLVILPLQDIVGNSGAFRMNVPGVAEGNWRYRARSSDLSSVRSQWLGKVAELYNRSAPSKAPSPVNPGV